MKFIDRKIIEARRVVLQQLSSVLRCIHITRAVVYRCRPTFGTLIWLKLAALVSSYSRSSHEVALILSRDGIESAVSSKTASRWGGCYSIGRCVLSRQVFTQSIYSAGRYGTLKASNLCSEFHAEGWIWTLSHPKMASIGLSARTWRT